MSTIPSPDVMPVDRDRWGRELHLSNFVNAYYQYRDLQSLPDCRTVLIVGPGQGLDTQVFRWRGYEVETFDIDPTFKPDHQQRPRPEPVCGRPVYVTCPNVLEHPAEPCLDTALGEIARRPTRPSTFRYRGRTFTAPATRERHRLDAVGTCSTTFAAVTASPRGSWRASIFGKTRVQAPGAHLRIELLLELVAHYLESRLAAQLTILRSRPTPPNLPLPRPIDTVLVQQDPNRSDGWRTEIAAAGCIVHSFRSHAVSDPGRYLDA